MATPIEQLILAAKALAIDVSKGRFGPPVTCVYNPLDYAWAAHEIYLRTYGATRKRVLFLGMNPGPFGMTQTGIPFGEIAAVRDWLRITVAIRKPALEHPKRPVQGFECRRSEVSGRRLWGLFAHRFASAEVFFKDHFVVNYCPLVFISETGSNITPDKLPAANMQPVLAACDAHLKRVVEILEPEWLVGVGDFAEKRGKALFANTHLKIGKILHPSPASPAANKDWQGAATRQLQGLGIWK
ncbi:MAG TPA: uracil-DNA glycosylase family protein [Candidatus Saccharimonadales bacterium]|nr:uracil-DNA glycosylase family protein [Candidatus Saccharimonadales bacterium]